MNETMCRKAAVENWKDLKYGMFIHYGLFSLCGGVWDGRKVERGYSEQILSHGNVPPLDYEALKDEFTAENFDAEKIVALAGKAGMKYIVPVTKHHDGFCLFDTATTDYSSAKGAAGRDLVKELSVACKKAGLKLGLYFSWIDWHCPDALPISSHNSDLIPEKHMEYNLAQLRELLTNYGEIVELWMDMGHPTYEQSRAVRELALSLQPNIMINGRIWNDMGDFLTMGDNMFPECELTLPWQTPATIYHETWGYRSWQVRDRFEEKVDTIDRAVHSVVEDGGNYLLNIGPMGDGSIVEFEEKVLLAVGERIEKKPLIRKEKKAEAFRVGSEFTLFHGQKRYRYTGCEYYSFHAISTGMSWAVETEGKGEYELAISFPLPLLEEVKLEIAVNDRKYLFPVKRGSVKAVIGTRFPLDNGRNEIVLSSPGEEMSKNEFKLDDASLIFKKRF